MKQFIIVFGLIACVLLLIPVASAQRGILPNAKMKEGGKVEIYIGESSSGPVTELVDCEDLLKNKDSNWYIHDMKAAVEEKPEYRDIILGCAIRTGRINLWMMPFLIVSLISFLTGLAGLIAVLFIVVGGYKYITGGITGDQESGKKTLTYAIIGLVVSLSAWIIINVIQYQVTR